MEKLYKGDIGILFVVDCKISVTGATVSKLKVKKPDGTEVDWTGAPFNNTIQYTIQTGDLNQAGEYRLQSYVELSGLEIHGDTALFEVAEEFE